MIMLCQFIEQHQNNKQGGKVHRVKTVLVVDDNIYAATYVISLMKISHPSAEVVHANHGTHPWKIINAPNTRPDLVISDVEMPEMDGVELAEKIQEKHPDVHVILMSGRDEPHNHRAHAFLPKPLVRGELIATIKRVLDRQRG